MSEKLIISRIQQRRGTKETLPTPLRPGELGLTSDSGQVWLGDDNLAPFGIRAFTPTVSIATVNSILKDRIVSIVFDGPISSKLFGRLKKHFLNELPFDGASDATVRLFNIERQLLWDGNRSVFLGLRTPELAAAVSFDANWGTDPAQAVTDIISRFPGGFPISRKRVVMANDEFQKDGSNDPDWITQENDNRILNFNNTDMDSPAGIVISKIVNTISSLTVQPRMLLNMLENIELGVVDLFLEEPPLNADVRVRVHLEDNIPITGPTYQAGQLSFDLEFSDVIFGDYSLNGDGFTAGGTIQILRLGDSVAVLDNRGGSNISSGEISLNAELDNGIVTLTYRNTTPSDAELKIIVRRWRHTVQ